LFGKGHDNNPNENKSDKAKYKLLHIIVYISTAKVQNYSQIEISVLSQAL
jgi:hypothetical protein